jgi:hypothetical protein
MQEIIDNGHVEEVLPDFTRQYEALPSLPLSALRRLRLLAESLAGATEVAQAAINAHNSRRTAYQQAFEAACEDCGIAIPPGEHDVQIDWANGDVRFVPK